MATQAPAKELGGLAGQRGQAGGEEGARRGEHVDARRLAALTRPHRDGPVGGRAQHRALAAHDLGAGQRAVGLEAQGVLVHRVPQGELDARLAEQVALLGLGPVAGCYEAELAAGVLEIAHIVVAASYFNRPQTLNLTGTQVGSEEA